MNPFLQWPLGWAATSLYNNSKAKPVVDDWTSSLAGLLGIGSAEAADDTTTPPSNPAFKPPGANMTDMQNNPVVGAPLEVLLPTPDWTGPGKGRDYAAEEQAIQDETDRLQYTPPKISDSFDMRKVAAARAMEGSQPYRGVLPPQPPVAEDQSSNWLGGLLDDMKNKDWGSALTSPLFVMGANLLANSSYDPTKQDAWSAIGAGAKGGITDLAALQKIRADKAGTGSYQKVMLGVPGQEPRNGFFDPKSGRYYYANGAIAPDNARIYSMNAQGSTDDLGITNSTKSSEEKKYISRLSLKREIGRMQYLLDADPGVVGVKGNLRSIIEGTLGQFESLRPTVDWLADPESVNEFRTLSKSIVGQVASLIQDDEGRKSDRDLMMAVDVLESEKWLTSPEKAKTALRVLSRKIQEMQAETEGRLGMSPASNPATASPIPLSPQEISALPIIKSKEERDALPPGTPYRTEDGRLFRKPKQ